MLLNIYAAAEAESASKHVSHAYPVVCFLRRCRVFEDELV